MGGRGAAICSILAGDTLRVEGWECAVEQSISLFKVTCHEVDCGKFVKMAVVPQAMYNGSVPNLRLDSPDKSFDDDEKSGLLLEEVCIYILMECNLLSKSYGGNLKIAPYLGYEKSMQT